LDTLKPTKRLEGAGLERQVAEGMAEAFAESTTETVATKDDLRHEAAALRSEIHASGSELRTEMQALGSELRTEMRALRSALRTEMRALGSELRTEMQALRWQVIGAVALLLLVHLSAVWGIVAAHTH
jgi:CHASE3 domain sensor protein